MNQLSGEPFGHLLGTSSTGCAMLNSPYSSPASSSSFLTLPVSLSERQQQHLPRAKLGRSSGHEGSILRKDLRHQHKSKVFIKEQKFSHGFLKKWKLFFSPNFISSLRILYNIFIPSPDSFQTHPLLPCSHNFMSLFFNPSSSVYAALTAIDVWHSLEGPYASSNRSNANVYLARGGTLCPPPLSKLKFCLA